MSYSRLPSIEFSFDRIFVSLLNRHKIRSKQVVGLRRFRQVFYTNREEHMSEKVKELLQKDQSANIVLVCGQSHVNSIINFFWLFNGWSLNWLNRFFTQILVFLRNTDRTQPRQNQRSYDEPSRAISHEDFSQGVGEEASQLEPELLQNRKNSMDHTHTTVS